MRSYATASYSNDSGRLVIDIDFAIDFDQTEGIYETDDDMAVDVTAVDIANTTRSNMKFDIKYDIGIADIDTTLTRPRSR